MEKYLISRTNYTKPRRTSRRNVQSAVPRARRMIRLTRRFFGSKRFRQHAKRAKASRLGTSPPPSPPWKGFKKLPTGDNSDSEEEDDYQEPNARATYAKAKFARIQPTIQKKTSQMDVEP